MGWSTTNGTSLFGTYCNAQEAEPAEPTSGATSSETEETVGEPTPWDYDPYRVLIWIASDEPAYTAEQLAVPLGRYLDQDFHALWRVDFANAPSAIRTAARRDFESMNFETLSESDPVIAVKRDHPEAIRIRFASDLPSTLQSIHVNRSRLEDLKRQGLASGDESLGGLDKLFQA
ncbi:MAG: hypothetical protein AAF989_00465, partial [Planctomycetota bacterium]